MADILGDLINAVYTETKEGGNTKERIATIMRLLREQSNNFTEAKTVSQGPLSMRTDGVSIYFTNASGVEKKVAFKGEGGGGGEIDLTELIESIEKAQKAADDAAAAAAAADADAKRANQVLANIANDNIVTVQEKPELFREWQIIQAEHPKILTNAATYGVPTGVYAGFYAALETFLTESKVFENFAVDTPVNGQELTGRFRDYYAARQDLLNAITEAAKRYVDSIQLGTANMLKKSNTVIHADANTYPLGGYGINKTLEIGKTYTLRFKSRISGGNYVGAWLNGQELITTGPINGGVFTKTFTVTTAGRNMVDFYKFYPDGVINPPVEAWVDWAVLVEGNRMPAGEWFPSTEDIQEQLGEAIYKADQANNKLSDIANDNKLTPNEKNDVILEWEIINDERPKIIEQASVFSVSWSDYQAEFTALSNYLISIGYADISYTSDINSTEFKAKFRNYYDAKIKLLRAVTEASKNYTNSEISKLQIGGANMLNKSANMLAERPENKGQTPNINLWVNDPSKDGFYAYKTDGAEGVFWFDLPELEGGKMIDGKQYTISMEVWSEWPFGMGIGGTNVGNALENGFTTVDRNWKRVYRTFTKLASSNNSFIIRLDAQGANYLMRNFKLEEGIRATPWARSQADLEKAAKDAKDAADKANVILSEIANDNIITPQEKPDVLKEWQTITGEFETIKAQSDTYGVDKTSYNTSFIYLQNYLTTIGIFADMNSNTNVDGANFRAHFTNYYDERAKLLKNISDASKSYTDNLAIGATNLLDDSLNIVYSPNNIGLGSHRWVDDGGEERYSEYTSDADKSVSLFGAYYLMKRGVQYCRGVYVRNPNNFEITVTVSDHQAIPNGVRNTNLPANSGWVWVKSFTAEGIDTNSAHIIQTSTAGGTPVTKLHIKKPMLVKGNRIADDWAPSYNDIQAQIKVAKDRADQANAVLTLISDDNILHRSEKPAVVKEWDEIDAEYHRNVANSQVYGVSSAAYSAAYSFLSSYLISIDYGNFNTDSPINGVVFRSNFTNYYKTLADLLLAISNAAKGYVNDTATEVRKEARLKLLAAQYASGECLNRDVDFRSGNNGLMVYNNASNGNVDLVRWLGARSLNAPTKSPWIIGCDYNGNGASPNKGGWTFSTQTRANAVFVVRMIIRLNAGDSLEFASNAAGDGYSFDWVTPNTSSDTNAWTEYIGVLRCGATGSFSSSMFFSVAGPDGVTSTQICYAAVYDVTEVDRYLEQKIADAAEAARLAQAQADNAMNTAQNVAKVTTFLTTTVNGNVVASGTMLIGDPAGANAGITGVTDNGTNSVRIWAGAAYEGRNNAPFRVLHNGKLFATGAEISGKITAETGEIGDFKLENGSMINGTSGGATYTLIDKYQVIFREKLGSGVRELMYGQTVPPSSGSRGAVADIKNTSTDNPSDPNIALRLTANGATENIAIDIQSGGIRTVGGDGITAWLPTSSTIRVVNGIIVDFY
ncbi:tail fiber protein [Elizabethkingia phage TCUEAP1]|nr:tail fiber protein [Elizabethkingia phage TCUEAP1]